MSGESLLSGMKAKIDAEKVQQKFDMTSYETAYYACRPTFFAFLAKYILCVTVLAVHLLFWWVNTSNGLNDDANGFAKFAFWLVDFLGMTGFVFFMLIVTWVNRFMNWSSSGGWYTVSLLIVTFTPALFVLDDIVATILGWFGSEFDGVIPFNWDESWYLLLGVAYFVFLTTLTIWYSRSFYYGVSDKAVYLKKDFMLNHTMHKIDMVDIDNMKLSQPWYGRILGFGTLNMLTGSGFGVRERTVSMSAGGVADIAASATDDTGFIKKILKSFFFIIKLQRTREEMNTSEPEDCMFGIRNPSEVYKLINELKEAIRNQSTTAQGTGQHVPSQEPVPVQAAPVEEAPAETLDGLDTDMNLE
ncbi:MAG TPA: PH domain-containing protein [Candidatus Thalassarchaeaceae archaeon]|jgi:hypothetical protein|nr:MAG TPA: PH domain-containing protein [Candidatus Poseidoniales archaeon]HIH83158.1 PH domain-containing protein [Candidatus Thalassarchaeaceae archaeon]